MRNAFLAACLLLTVVLPANGATLATFQVGSQTMQLELFDEDKPVTVSNFIQYVVSGRYENQIIHRWVPGFVIQGGGYRVDTSGQQFQLAPVQTFGTITNEYSVGGTFSNIYGTIAMARQSGNTNSATSQWYINLGDNSELDQVDGGFTVFGRLISGTNLLNLFIPPSGTVGIYTNNNIVPGSPVPVLTSSNVTFNHLVYVDVLLERELDLAITRSAQGDSVITWNGVAGVTNVLEFTSELPPSTWTPATNLVGTGSPVQFTDPAATDRRTYRVKLQY